MMTHKVPRKLQPRRGVVSLLVLALGLASTAGCSANYNYPYAKEPNPEKLEYVIGVADTLSVRVWRNHELDTNIAVRPDGTITMPLIGDVKAGGFTPTELKARISKALAEFIKDGAAVTVAVTSVNSYYVTVSGQVGRPGVINAKHYLSVAEAIALAGGPTRFASPGDTVLLRRNKVGHAKSIPINYDKVASGAMPQMNLVLFRGDTVHVP